MGETPIPPLKAESSRISPPRRGMLPCRMRLGIDFGTTRTVVACADRGNYPVVTFQDEAGNPVDWYPSVAAERRGELRFGFDALAMAAEPEWTVLRSFK